MDIRYRTGKILRHPALMVLLSFGVLICIGALLLKLPYMHYGSLSFMDALFTATSCVCVTGLTVVDTATAFTRLGQWVMVFLMEAGGLGVMTFSILSAIAIKRHLGLSSRFIIREGFLSVKIQSIPRVVGMIVFYSLGVEAAVSLILTTFFLREYSMSTALFHGIFHGVSAFCNAGFSTFPKGLEGYTTHWGVCLTIMAGILLGNTGFSIFYELKERILKRSTGPLSLHLKLTVTMHLALLVLGTLAIMATEARGLLKDLPLSTRILIASFHSVSARTAGFNTVAISGFTEDSLYLMVILMFIGACPGSTGGGIKTTTISVLLVAAMSRLRGFMRATVAKRTISDETVQKALVLFVLSIMVIFLAHISLMLAGPNLPFRSSHSEFLAYLFETVSGLGTVGLSVGVTANLTDFGKILMIAIMYVGRVGLLSVVSVLTMAGRSPRPYSYPEENVMVG